MSLAASSIGRRAVVLGASMAGLLCARVLAERFDEVCLLDRDALPTGPAPRKGTPQAQHAHGLLARGRLILESLFPGYTAALVSQGALAGDLLANAPFVAGGRRFAQGPCTEQGLACSRLAIEAELRRRVLALPQVRAITGIDVEQPTFDQGSGRVTGVRIAHRTRSVQEILAADFVVDCTGRGSRTPAWLREWGYEPPAEDRVVMGMGYATAHLRREAHHATGIAALIFAATPEQPLPGVLLAQEPAADGVPRWVVSMGGYAGDHPQATIEGMRERARRMGDATLVRILEQGELLGPVTRYSMPHSQRRRYEHLARFPERYLVLGDAIASFNPVYGQGMTVAACEAIELRQALDAGLQGVSRRFFSRAAKAIDIPWQLAVGADLAIPQVPGERSMQVRFVNAYLARLFRVAPQDPKVALAFARVAHLLAPPALIFAPGTVARVLWQSRGGASAGESTPVGWTADKPHP